MVEETESEIMPHALCVGVSGSGKTTLMKQLAKKLPRVAVCEYGGKNKVGKTNWGKSIFHTLDINEMLWFSQHNIKCNIFIDDAGDNLARMPDCDFFTTCGRRWGHTMFLITQRAMQVTPNIRSNCETVYCFRQEKMDVKAMCESYGESFEAALTLPKGQFLARRTPFDAVSTHKIF